jgi:hypothetical protein
MNETKVKKYWGNQLIEFDYSYNYGTYIGHSYSRNTSTLNATDSRQGSDLPKFRQIIREGGNATTGFTGVRQVCEIENGNMSLVVTDTSGNIEVYHTSGANQREINSYGFPASTISDVSANNQALKFIYRRIREERSAFQGGIFLGEALESLKMISSPAKTLRTQLGKYLDAVVRRESDYRALTLMQKKRARRAPAMIYNFKQTQRDLESNLRRNSRRAAIARETAIGKSLADTWLEYSFGWSPLVNDIQTAQKAFRKLMDEWEYTTKLSGVGKDEETTSTADYNQFGQIWNVLYKRITTDSIMVRYLCGMRSRTFKAPGDARLSEQFGFVIEQFIPTVWELLPWSFLVDYFTNIGDILDASATCTADISWVAKTIRRSVEVKATGTPTSWKSGNTTYSASGSAGCVKKRVTSVIRGAVSGLPNPTFRVEVPTLSTQWINMLALSQNMKRLRSFWN